MKSMNNLLLLGDGESWSRQTVDFAGLPEMARTFLQVAAGAADIPVTRLLGQSPSGLAATGESDTRNYYDMIAARQELDLRPQLERLDRLICWSEGIDESALSFAFRPLWQLDEPARAALALSRAQATQIYAGLKLWPDAVMAKLVKAQLVADGTYPNAAAVFAEGADNAEPSILDAFPVRPSFNPNEPRNPWGRWTTGEGSEPAAHPDARLVPVSDPEEIKRRLQEEEVGGPGPLEDPALVPGEDPLVKLIPGAASHGLLENVPSPLTVLPVFPRNPVESPSTSASPAQGVPTTATSSLPASAGVPKTGGVSALPEPETNPGRSAIRAGKTVLHIFLSSRMTRFIVSSATGSRPHRRTWRC